MIKRLLLIATLGVMLSGCYMVPLAFIGPATSGWSTASIIQSSLTSGSNFLVKKTTGKTIGQHAFDAISRDILQQAYFPKIYKSTTASPK